MVGYVLTIWDGKLRVFKWPDMEITLDEVNAHASVNDLDFSPDGNFLASIRSSPGRIWKVATATSIASLPKENVFLMSKLLKHRREFSLPQETIHLNLSRIQICLYVACFSWIQGRSFPFF
ncbi:SEC12 2 [Olea europaea subsp. europaea]|uniref:SEC12 2 n=1 Tax=Olea europaea subsp. europaea TaxID=158383 RepID=A0A8S0U7W7_OLEEU|nr:SEC12 2 [Olea europaea subsp. europaea]